VTERKPRGLSFTSWIDQQVADAERRGVFDNLPGAGKPLAIRPEGGADFGQAWMRDYARREGVAPEEFLPTPLRLRREIERLGETVSGFGSEAEVREAAAELNRRIVQWRRIPLGPPVHVRLVKADELVRQWRSARSAAGRACGAAQEPAATAASKPKTGQPDAAGPAGTGQPGTAAGDPSGRRRWWRR
jgi:hypothetical protein